MNEQVFISYSSKDSEWAEEMARILRENGISYWKAPESIPPGGNYNIEIPKGIERCPIFLVLLSENAAASEYVPNELDLAKTEHKYIIPVQIAEYDSYVFKLALVNKQVYPWRDIDRIINQIRQQLRIPRAEVRLPRSVSAAPQASVHPLSGQTDFVELVQTGGGSPGGKPGWIKWAIAACAVLVLGIAGFMALRGMSGQGTAQGEPGESFGGGRDKDHVVSTAPSDEPEENSEAVASAAPSPAPEEPEPMKLTEMHIMASDRAEMRENATNTVGETYDKAVYLYSPPAFTYVRHPYITFYLGGEYSLFTGTVSCPDEAHYGSTYRFQVILDESEEPAVDIEFGRATPPTPLEIDVSGCQTIKFYIDTPGNVGAMIPDGLLTP